MAAENNISAPLPDDEAVQGDQYNNLAHTRNIPDLVLTPGQWNFISCVVPGSARTDSLRLRIVLQRYEPGDCFYFDNMQLFEIAEQGTDQ